MAWSRSGDRIVTGHSSGSVRVWDAASGKLLWHKLLGPVKSRSDSHAQSAFVSFSRDGKLLVAAGAGDGSLKYDNGIVAIFETASGRTVREIPQEGIQWAALAPDGRMVVVGTSHGGYGDTHFIGLEVATGQTRWANPPGDQRDGFCPVAGAQFVGNSPWFQAALKDGSVIRFNPLTGHEQRPFRVDWRTPQERLLEQPAMGKPAFSDDGRTLVTFHMGWLYVRDVESGTIRREFRHPHPHGCNITLAPDGHTLATSDIRYAGDAGQDTIRLCEIVTGEQVLAVEPGDGRAAVMAFSPDGTRLFSGFNRGSVYTLRRKCGKPNCRCSRGQLHESTVLSYRGEGRPRNVSPPPEQLGSLRTMTHHYRRCRQARAKLVRWQQQLLKLVDALEAARVQQGEVEFRKLREAPPVK